MDVADLESKLPAETVAAVSQITGAGQVYVAREPRRIGTTNPQAWWRPVGSTADETATGASRSGREYLLHIEQETADLPTLQRMAEQVQGHFHGFRRPASVTGLIWVEVGSVVFDVHGREDPAGTLAVTLTFHGED